MLKVHLLGAYRVPPTNQVSRRLNISSLSNSTAYLKTRSRRKHLVRKEIGQLLSRSDLVSLVISFLCSKCQGDVLELPWLNVIVTFFPSMDITLDGVSVVAYDKSILR